jgi:prophage DNA circulation protein
MKKLFAGLIGMIVLALMFLVFSVQAQTMTPITRDHLRESEYQNRELLEALNANFAAITNQIKSLTATVNTATNTVAGITNILSGITSLSIPATGTNLIVTKVGVTNVFYPDFKAP